MASTREERFLMRQRGAGTRQLRGSGSGFGFELPTIASSARKTPTPAQRNSSRSISQPRRSPAITTPTPAQRRRLSKRTPNARVSRGSAPDEGNAAAVTQRDSDGSITKKRRVTGDTGAPVNQLDSLEDIAEEAAEEDVPRVATLQTAAIQTSPPAKKRKKRKSVLLKSRRKSRPSLDAMANQIVSSSSAHVDVGGQPPSVRDREVGKDKVSEAGVSNDEELVDELLGSNDIEDEAEEINALQDNELEDVGEEDGVPKDISPEDRRENDVTDEHEDNRDDEMGNEAPHNHTIPAKPKSSHLKTSRASGSATQVDRSEAPISSIAVPRPKKKKRRSIIMGRTKHRSSGDRSAIFEQAEATEEHPATNPSPARGGKQSGTLKRPNLKQSKLNRRRPRTQEATIEDPAPTSSSARGQKDDSSLQRSSLTRPSLLKKKRPLAESKGNTSTKPRNRVASPETETEDPKQRKQSTRTTPKPAAPAPADKIQVTIHRLSHVHRLNFNPTIDDPLSGPGAFPRKKTPNAIDVLAQICREIIGKTLSTVKNSLKTQSGSSGGNTARQAQLKRKRDAIETYGDELDGRLFQMTVALDHNYALGVKLRSAKRKKDALREEVLDMRRRRGEVEVQIDEVRAKHESEAREAEAEERLRGLLMDIELAVERGRGAPALGGSSDEEEDDEEGGEGRGGLLMRVQQVTDRVSSADGMVGVLERVKGFNGLLEEAIAKL